MVLRGSGKRGLARHRPENVQHQPPPQPLTTTTTTTTPLTHAAETGILTDDFVHPNPSFGFAKVEDVVSAFIAGISDPDPKTNYGAYLIPDAKGVYRMEATRNL